MECSPSNMNTRSPVFGRSGETFGLFLRNIPSGVSFLRSRAGTKPWANSATIASANKNAISHARQIANDLEDGFVRSPKDSIIFKVKTCEKLGMSIFNQERPLYTIPRLKSSLLVFSMFYTTCMAWAVYLLLLKNQSKQGHQEDRVMRLQGQVGRHEEVLAREADGSVQPVDEDSIVTKKLEDVRNMARLVRSPEQRQALKSDLELQTDRAFKEASIQPYELLEKTLNNAIDDRNSGTKKSSATEKTNEVFNDVQRLARSARIDTETTTEIASPQNPVCTDKETFEDVYIRKMSAENGELASLGVISPKCQFVQKGATQGMNGKGQSLAAVGNDASECRKNVGKKPRVIMSVKEARAKVATRKARVGGVTGSTYSSQHGHDSSSLQETKLKARRRFSEKLGVAGTANMNDVLQVETQDNACALQDVEDGNETKHQCGQTRAPSNGNRQEEAAGKMTLDLLGQVLAKRSKDKLQEIIKDSDSHDHKDIFAGNEGDEAEELEWMRDKVLREIVFKVKANEDAGKEPFHGLDAQEEKLFFKGLEKKFEQEGKRVNDWINEHVENMDYGLDGIGIDDPPDAYMLRWKDPAKAPKPHSMDWFFKQRERILSKQMETEVSASTSGSTSRHSHSDSSSHSSSFSRMPTAANKQSETFHSPFERIQENEGTSTSAVSNCRTVVTSSGQPLNRTGSLQHTKKWGKELQRKYEMETSPETRALMREFGQDLEHWVTEEEVEESSRLLSMGVEGEEEYIQRHYERVKAKIAEERERFGWEAMVNKYKEYQPQKEDDLWWLDLSVILCIGVCSSTYSKEGLYSLNMAPDFGEPGKRQIKNHVIAFQDQNDALKFCYLLQSKPDECKFDVVKVCPYSPKQLYKDAKAEGFKVTVLREGQVVAHAGQTIDEAIQRIVEIGSGVYWEKFIRDRSIDADTVLDQCFNYGPSL